MYVLWLPDIYNMAPLLAVRGVEGRKSDQSDAAPVEGQKLGVKQLTVTRLHQVIQCGTVELVRIMHYGYPHRCILKDRQFSQGHLGSDRPVDNEAQGGSTR